MNGKIPLSDLTRIPHPGGAACYLRNDAARAWDAMRQESIKRFGVDLHPLGSASAYRSFSQQSFFWNLYKSGGGNLAAYPGTSNHGWAVAVDLATQKMAWVLRQIGAKYGWKKVEAFNEWWHFNYVGGYTAPVKKSPYDYLTKKESAVVKEYLALKKAKRNPKRRGELFRWMIAQRKAIYRAAITQKGGWDKFHRRVRYKTFANLTRTK